MTPIVRSIARARRRLYLQHFLSVLGWLIVIALTLVGVLLCIDRLFAVPIGRPLYGVIGGLVLFVAIIWTWRRMPDAADTAATIDQRMGLKDRLGSALFAQNVETDPFAKHVVVEAQQIAERLKLQDGFPIRLTRVWAYLPPLAVMVAVMVVFLPRMDLLGLSQARQEQQRKEIQSQQATSQVIEAITAIEQIHVTQPESSQNSDSPQTDTTLRELAQITRQDLSNPKLRSEAAAKLSHAQHSLAQKADEKHKQVEQFRNALSRVKPPTPGPADEFANALRRGDFDAARDALQQTGR